MVFRTLILSLIFLAPCCCADTVSAQTAVNAGRKFAFGIPEGPDRQVPPGGGESRIFLTFLGTTDGCAVITGPDGFSATLNFNGRSQREIEIPVSYMQKWEEGYNKKGFIVETTQPVGLELHNVFESAGESTQIFPMEMLDGDYLLSGWSLFNDTIYAENNRAQFLITAAENNTEVTITAPNGLLPDIAPGTTFNMTLNAGECYIGKMDTTLNKELTTTQVLVKATKPVSVLQANTCGYVPYGVQSCNMMLDQVLPRKYFDTVFYMQPISKDVKSDHVLLTGAQQNFSAITSDGTFYQTSNGRIDVIIDKPTMIKTNILVMGQLLTPGSAQAATGQSDPTWVTLPTERIWDDTLKWYAQPPVGGSQPFNHFITIVGPQSAFSEIMIDDAHLTDFATLNTITGTAIFTTQIGVSQGDHILKSPVPVGAIVNGIRPNDAFTFLPSGTLPNRYQPRPIAEIDLTTSQAKFCTDMNAELLNALTISTLDQIVEVTALITYDPMVLRPSTVLPGSFFQNISGAVVDASTPGELKINVKVDPGKYLTGAGTLIDAMFTVDPDVSATSLSGVLTLRNDEICDNTRTFTLDVPVTIEKIIEKNDVTLSLADLRDDGNDFVSTDIIIEGIVSDADVREFDVSLDWDHDLIGLEEVIQDGLQSESWAVDRIDESPTHTRFHFKDPSGGSLSNGKLLTLSFRAFLADTSTTEIALSSSIESHRKCPLVLDVANRGTSFSTEALCGDGLLRNLLRGETLGARISPNPSTGRFTLELARPLCGSVRLTDALGHEVGRWQVDRQKSIELLLPSGIASGVYDLRVESGAALQNLPILIQK